MLLLNKILRKILIYIIKIYSFFSPFFYKGTCRFHPTCSNYAIQAIKKYGPFLGIYKALARLLRCHPFGNYGYDTLKKKGATK